jgi:pyridoxine 4-dehydrogenase
MTFRHAKRTLENVSAGNIDLSAEDLKAIDEILATYEVTGDRYFGDDKAIMLWG